MPPAQARKASFYRPELDVLRFFAFACVYMVHLRSGGQFFQPYYPQLKNIVEVGLPLFFFLSSFLITELLQREQARTGAIHMQMFYVRRILRIWPLYLAMILGVYFFWHATPPFEAITRGRFLSYLLMAGNWYCVVQRNIGLSPLCPLWSISVEEQFYLLWPFLYKRGGKAGATIVSLLTLPIALIAIAFITRKPDAMDVQLWCNSFVIFIFFGGGALAALYKDRIPRPSGTVARIALFAASILLCHLGGIGFTGDHITFTHSVIRYACFLLASAGLLFSFYGSHQAGRFRVLIYLGKISYGLYVFHMLAQEWSERCTAIFLRYFRHGGGELGPLLSIAFTIALASLSYRFFESPFLRLKKRFEVVTTRAV